MLNQNRVYKLLILISILYVYIYIYILIKYTLENSKGAIKNGQSRENGKIGYKRQRKPKHNTICVGQHYT